MPKSSVAVVVLNWNDAELLPKSVGSLFNQSHPCDVVVVDNGSEDNSREVIEGYGEKVASLYNKKNEGFAGGVNTGIRYALQQDYEYIALLNNDATADKNWVKELVEAFKDPKTGGVTCSLLDHKGTRYDSTGENLSSWGLPYPRGRDEKVNGQYDELTDIFGVSGGASIYRAELFKEVGLFDEDFFAYYEDVDLAFRGQLAGWKFKYAPKAKAYHKRGSTSGRVKNFTTYQTLKNLPWLLWKNVPLSLIPRILPRFTLSYCLFVIRALFRGQILTVAKALLVKTVVLPKKLWQRWSIQHNKNVNTGYIASILTWDLPPNADALRRLRSKWWHLRGKI